MGGIHMFIQPVYNILLLPDVTYYFKKDYFAERADELKPDTDLLFVLLKNETEGDRLQAEDFYSVGLSARVESISEEDVIQIRTTDRVEVLSPAIEDGAVRAAFAVRPSVNDLSAGEQQQIFSKVRADLLRFVQGYQWGLWARGFILQRKNIYDLVSSLSEYLNLSVHREVHLYILHTGYQIENFDNRSNIPHNIKVLINYIQLAYLAFSPFQ